MIEHDLEVWDRFPMQTLYWIPSEIHILWCYFYNCIMAYMMWWPWADKGTDRFAGYIRGLTNGWSKIDRYCICFSRHIGQMMKVAGSTTVCGSNNGSSWYYERVHRYSDWFYHYISRPINRSSWHAAAIVKEWIQWVVLLLYQRTNRGYSSHYERVDTVSGSVATSEDQPVDPAGILRMVRFDNDFHLKESTVIVWMHWFR